MRWFRLGGFEQSLQKLARLLALRELYRLVNEKHSPEARGRNLLRAWLTVEQRDQFDSFGYFDVRGCASGKKYRIHFGISANVHELGDGDLPKMGWCFVPAGNLVPGDVMLAQKIALETSETAALAVANPFPATPPICRGHLRRQF
jgi:hypothetical protein